MIAGYIQWNPILNFQFLLQNDLPHLNPGLVIGVDIDEFSDQGGEELIVKNERTDILLIRFGDDDGIYGDIFFVEQGFHDGIALHIDEFFKRKAVQNIQ